MRGKDSVVWLLIVTVLHSSTGCGTLISGTHQDVTVAMTPPDAQVAIYRWNGERIAGPESASKGTVNVHRPKWNQPYLVQAFKDGHCPQYWLTTSKPSTGAWFVLPFVVAIAFFPIAGLLVTIPLTLTDSMTGGCCSVEPSSFDGLLMEGGTCTE